MPRRFMRGLTESMCVVVALSLVNLTCAGSIVYVDDDAPAGGDGQTWRAAFRYLQDALDEADRKGDVSEIRIAQGSYQPDRSEQFSTGTGDRTVSFELRSGVALIGGYAGLGTADPDEHEPTAFHTILTGDLGGNDDAGRGEFAGTEENAFHVVVGRSGIVDAQLDGVIITRGNANGSSPDSLGGGLLNEQQSSPIISNCVFLENQAVQGGGLMNRAGADAVIIDCEFTRNHASVSGGGVQNLSNAPTIMNCRFEANRASNIGGGALYNLLSTIDVIECLFLENETSADGGAVLSLNCHIAFDACSFIDNEAIENGGGISDELGVLTVSNCIFESNLASNGSGLHVSSVADESVVSTSSFLENLAVDDGGGVRVFGDGAIEVLDCSFIANIAGDVGGGLAVQSVSDACRIVACVFEKNLAHEFGAGAACSFSECIMESCLFRENAANEGGGGLYVSNGSPSILGSTFEMNGSPSSGAGAYCSNDETMMIGCEFLMNDAVSSGAGTVHVNGSETQFDGCVFHNNVTGSFSSGGAMSVNASSPQIMNSAFIENSSNLGGALNCSDGSAPQFADTIFLANVAFSGGAAFMLESAPTFSWCEFRENEALFSSLARGGAILNQLSDTVLLDCIVAENFASRLGGGLYSDGGAPLVMNCAFQQNIARSGGGAYLQSGTPLLINSLFNGNAATGNIDDSGGKDGEVLCEAIGVGGAVLSQLATTALINCTVHANVAQCEGRAGGVSMIFGSIDNCAIWSNTDDGDDVEEAQIEDAVGLVEINYSCVQGWTGTLGGEGNIGEEPRFVDPFGMDRIAGTKDDNLRLAPGSPCIDAGNSDAIDSLKARVPVDLAGAPRLVDDPKTIDTGIGNPVVDIGAYEYQVDACPADLDQDGSIAFGDLLLLLDAWGACAPPVSRGGGDGREGNCAPDLNSDGEIGFADLLLLLNAWGRC